MGFNVPPAPTYMTFPAHAQHWANGVLGLLVLGLAVAVTIDLIRSRKPVGVFLVLGGALSYCQEPILDVLGPLWHPRPGQDVALNTFGPAPLWGLFAYTLFFGGGTYVAYRLLQRPTTRTRVWLALIGLFAVNLAIELPLLSSGMYRYYGFREPPMEICGLPAYWLIINAGAPLAGACLILGLPRAFAGLSQARIVFVPVVTYAAYSIATGWPVFTAAHISSLPAVFDWIAALVTIGIGVTIMDELARWIDRRSGAGSPPTA